MPTVQVCCIYCGTAFQATFLGKLWETTTNNGGGVDSMVPICPGCRNDVVEKYLFPNLSTVALSLEKWLGEASKKGRVLKLLRVTLKMEVVIFSLR